MDHLGFLGLTMVAMFQGTLSSQDTYSAVVVEYSPLRDPTTDPATNILNNVMNFVTITNIANERFQADIIVFPEDGLKGFGNQEQYMFVPDPQDNVRPCASNTTYDASLVQLSCVARATHTYLVVNLGEKFYNSSQRKTVYFNTDVVFDSNGVIIARYRKIHLFGESGKTPSPNQELVYFDTEFGVRFGIFTCFDIIFEEPGVILANVFNITHFIFPTAWFSQMPFLTAIQEQYFWSYTQDVVLLASGYNEPSVGSTGTGIYLGRQGPAIYSMTESKKTFMLQAHVPKDLHFSGVGQEKNILQAVALPISENKEEKKKNIEEPSNKLKLKQEGSLKMYETKSIIPPKSSIHGFDGKSFSVPFIVNEFVCQNSLCCQFSLNITVVFNQTCEVVRRGDDYSEMFYRLAVFDGVRDYDKVDYGGLQTCAIIPCINSELSSCGLRADDPSAKPNMIYEFFQTAFIFNSITIRGNFSDHSSSVGSNVLLGGDRDDFGSLLLPKSFTFYEAPNSNNGTFMRSFQTLRPIPNLVTASLYGRLFFRDKEQDHRSSSGFVCNSFIILILSLTFCCMSFFSLTSIKLCYFYL